MIRVGVFGAGGRMGTTVCRRRASTRPTCELVAAVDPHHAGIDLDQLGVHGTDLADRRPSASALRDAGAEVAVDFTVIDAARENLRVVRGATASTRSSARPASATPSSPSLASCFDRRRRPTR